MKTFKDYLKEDMQQMQQQEQPQAAPAPAPVPEENPADIIRIDVPLMIRLLEFAREDSQSDLDLHNLTEKLIVACAEPGKNLSMADYDSLVAGDALATPQEEQPISEMKNTYERGDKVETPCGTGTVVSDVAPNGNVSIKLDDPSRAGEDGKYKDTFTFTTFQLKHVLGDASGVKSVEFHDGDRVTLKPDYAGNEAGEVFIVSQCDNANRRCWIGDKQGRGWFAKFGQLDKAVRVK